MKPKTKVASFCFLHVYGLHPEADKATLDGMAQWFKEVMPSDVMVTWRFDPYCGCSCPCSPGIRFFAKFKMLAIQNDPASPRSIRQYERKYRERVIRQNRRDEIMKAIDLPRLHPFIVFCDGQKAEPSMSVLARNMNERLVQLFGNAEA